MKSWQPLKHRLESKANGVHADYHQVSDEVSKNNFSLLAKQAQLVFYTAWDLVNANQRPVVYMNK